MSRRRIYLHAGMHKTGTTSIQKYLLDNEDVLSERGFHVLHDIDFGPIEETPGANSTNCLRLAHLFLRDDFATPIKLRQGLRRYGAIRRLRDIVRLRRRLEAIPSPNIVISAEALSFLRTRREKMFLRYLGRGFELVPVVFFRDPADWQASWKRQMGGLRRKLEQEGRFEGGRPDGYRRHVFDFSPGSPLADRGAIRRFFGRGIYIDYESAIEKWGSSVPAFLAAVGLDPGGLPSSEAYRFNRTAEKRVW